MDIKIRITAFINQILIEYKLTQRQLAALLGINVGRISAYVKGRDCPKIEVLIELAKVGGMTLDELVTTNNPPAKKEVVFPVSGGKNIGLFNGPINTNGGDINVAENIYNNTSVRKIYTYSYQPGDLTEEQAAKLKALVDAIVKLEKLVSKNPKTYAAVYNALKKRYKVVYYRKIGEEEFPKAEAYLRAWKGRLLHSRDLPQKDNELYRKARYSAIFAAAKNRLGLTKKALDGYIFAEYGVNSIRNLDNTQLEHLYTTVMVTKKKKGK